MTKIVMGLVATIVVAAGGFFGFGFYTQHRITAEIEAAFDQIRATGGKASHGKVSFDLWSHTVKIADIASESAMQPPVSVKIASFTASGVSQPDPARFSADNIEVAEIEFDARMAGQAGWHITSRVPRIALKDYSGPAGLQQRPAAPSAIETYRFALRQFAAVVASSVTVPSLVVRIDAGAMPGFDYTYSGLSLQDIKNGKIAAIKVDRAALAANVQQTGKAEKFTGELANIAAYDFDAAAAEAILDPRKATDDRYYRMYRQTTAGAYELTFEKGLHMRIDGMTVDDVGVRPARLQLPALFAMIPPAGNAAALTPAQGREMIEKLATLYEGVRIGNAEMRGLSMETPQGPFRLSAMRMNLENGKVGEFAIEGLDAPSPKGPVKIGRFALKSLDIANLMRMSAQFANPAQKPVPDRLLGLFPLLEGVEVKAVTAPFKDTGRLVNLDTFNLDWGKFVGPIPSRARLTAKMTTPIDVTDPAMKPLIAAGMNTLAGDGDIGAIWTEASGTFVLEPVRVNLGSMVEASARVSLANVPRGVFSVNPQQATAMAAQIEAGTIEITLRDIGGVDLAVAEYARAQNVSTDAAQRAIVENIKGGGATETASNPDAVAIVDALTRFIENPRGVLMLKLTPRGKVPAMQLIQAIKTDPLVALAQFQVEASTAR